MNEHEGIDPSTLNKEQDSVTCGLSTSNQYHSRRTWLGGLCLAPLALGACGVTVTGGSPQAASTPSPMLEADLIRSLIDSLRELLSLTDTVIELTLWQSEMGQQVLALLRTLRTHADYYLVFYNKYFIDLKAQDSSITDLSSPLQASEYAAAASKAGADFATPNGCLKLLAQKQAWILNLALNLSRDMQDHDAREGTTSCAAMLAAQFAALRTVLFWNYSDPSIKSPAEIIPNAKAYAYAGAVQGT